MEQLRPRRLLAGSEALELQVHLLRPHSKALEHQLHRPLVFSEDSERQPHPHQLLLVDLVQLLRPLQLHSEVLVRQLLRPLASVALEPEHQVRKIVFTNVANQHIYCYFAKDSEASEQQQQQLQLHHSAGLEQRGLLTQGSLDLAPLAPVSCYCIL